MLSSVRSVLDGKTKPVGSLGRIEDLAARIAAIQGSARPVAERCTLTLFVADHGIAADGVSAFPPDVTRQMLLNFLSGGAAASVMAAALGVGVRIVDAGVAGPPVDHPARIDRRLGEGTRNSRIEPAMDRAALERALAQGRALGADSPGEAAAFGEMGIGNSAAAALIAHKIGGLPLDRLVGRGTGLDDAGLARKTALLAEAAARTAPALDPEAALAEYGGFEIAMMAGAFLGAARAGRIVLVDGFIATAAALAAGRIDPSAAGHFVFAHRSAERGHDALLETMGARPLLDLGLRLGEGTGALLAWPLVKAAAAMLRDMASFESAGVSGRA